MFKIKSSQEEAFADSQVNEFRDRLLNRIREHLDAERAISDWDLKAIIDRGIRICEDYGIYTAHDVSVCVGITLAVGHDIDKVEWASEILSQGSLSGAAKVRRLYERACELLIAQEGGRT